MTTDFERELSAFLQETTPHPPAAMTAPAVATLTARREAPSVDFDATGPGADVRDDLRDRRRRRLRPLLVAAAAAVVIGASLVGVVLTGRSAHGPAAHHSSLPRCFQSAEDVKESTSADGSLGTVRLTYSYRNAGPCAAVLPIYNLISITQQDTRFPGPPGARNPVTVGQHGHVIVVFRVRLAANCPASAAKARLVERSDFWGYDAGARYTLGIACVVAPIAWTFTVSR